MCAPLSEIATQLRKTIEAGGGQLFDDHFEASFVEHGDKFIIG
jgi:hypothetical protein